VKNWIRKTVVTIGLGAAALADNPDTPEIDPPAGRSLFERKEKENENQRKNANAPKLGAVSGPPPKNPPWQSLAPGKLLGWGDPIAPLGPPAVEASGVISPSRPPLAPSTPPAATPTGGFSSFDAQTSSAKPQSNAQIPSRPQIPSPPKIGQGFKTYGKSVGGGLAGAIIGIFFNIFNEGYQQSRLEEQVQRYVTEIYKTEIPQYIALYSVLPEASSHGPVYANMNFSIQETFVNEPGTTMRFSLHPNIFYHGTVFTGGPELSSGRKTERSIGERTDIEYFTIPTIIIPAR
jgi:hypothetical protein